MLVNEANVAILAVDEMNGHEEIFYQSAEFWVGCAFILVVAALIVPIARVIKTQATNRIARIKKELQDAEDLKLDAQKLYANYERKLLNANKEVADVLAEENAAIAEAKERQTQNLNTLLRRKQIEAEAKMEIAFERANAEINKLISKRTTEILRNVISRKLTKESHNMLIDQAINNINSISLNIKE